MLKGREELRQQLTAYVTEVTKLAANAGSRWLLPTSPAPVGSLPFSTLPKIGPGGDQSAFLCVYMFPDVFAN